MKRYVCSLLAALVLAAAALAATSAGHQPPAPKLMSARHLDINAWDILTTNYGKFVYPAAGSGGYWGGPGYNYIYGAGLWFAGTDGAGHRNVSVGYNPNSGSGEMGPVNPYTEDYANWLSDPQARVYLSTDPVDVLEWPLRDNGQPVINSQQDSYCKYSDQNPQYTYSGELPNNVVVEQITYAWNYADNNDIVFFFLRVKNKNNYTLINCFLGPCVDCDIGTESVPNANDRTAFDYTRNLSMQFQSTPEPGWPRTGVVGFRFFEGPVNNTGAVVNVVDIAPVGYPNFSHSIQPGQPLGMTAFKVFVITNDPNSDEERYLFMEGRDPQTMILDAYDEWGGETPGDKRFMMASGPFLLGPDSVVTTCVGAMAADDTTQLKAKSDIAQEIYNNGFVLAEPPALPQICATPGDNKVYLSWNKIAETTPDPYYPNIDSVCHWYTYYQGSYAYMADKNLVDSFMIKTGASTWVAVARGASNPPGGTDTISAWYSQRALYQPYDFQAYALFRAGTQAGLLDPEESTQIGILHIGTSGARSYNWDKADGYQIVRDICTFAYTTPETTYYLPIYDTLGTDCGLGYGFVDNSAVNGIAYWYGLSAIDYQPNVYFTHKCPTTLASSPAANAVMAIPLADPPGSQPAGIQIRVDIGDTVTTDYWYNTVVVNPQAVPDDSFKLYWQPVAKKVVGSNQYPVYRGHLYNMAKQLLDSTLLVPSYGAYGVHTDAFYGAAENELAFGGIVFQPFLEYSVSDAQLDSVLLVETPGGLRDYPEDSVSMTLNVSIYSRPICLWQWRGSDYEIRWKDTVNAGGNPALTAQVWDLTNNVEVPLETGVTKANMTKSSWCFNPLTSAGVALIDSNGTASIGMHIAGLSLYFNKAGTTIRRMTGSVWAQRPETGDVWRVCCSGPRPPHQGGQATFILSPAVVGVEGRPEGQVMPLLLAQNLPNPFRQSTIINFQLSKPGLVSLKVYNVAGQLVKTVVDAQKSAGNYSATWDGRDQAGRSVAAGVYLYQLRAGDRALTRKMVLL